MAERRLPTKQEPFNYRHSLLRNAVERVFGVFQRRWRIFDRPHEFPMKTPVKLMYTLAGIHNFINASYNVEDGFKALGEHERKAGEQARRDGDKRGNLGAVSDMGASETRWRTMCGSNVLWQDGFWRSQSRWRGVGLVEWTLLEGV
jgi:hypothetical protein